MKDSKKNELKAFLGSYNLDEFNEEQFDIKSKIFLENLRNDEHLDKIIDSIDLELADEDVFFILIKPDTTFDMIEEKLGKSTENKELIKNVYIFEILDTPIRKRKDEEIVGIRRKIQEKLGKKLSLTYIKYESVFIANVPKNKTVDISIESRVRSLEKEIRIPIEGKKKEEKNKEELILKGYVFSARLSDIIKIYEELGYKLFEKNVRFSVGEQLEVNRYIGDTIKNNGDMFWYLNNGISLYVEDDRQLDLSNYDKLKLSIGEENPVSIINGAQTITASSKINKEYWDKIADSYVLLRIFVFSSSDSNKDKINLIDSKLDEITVALNRQKPIKLEDIAYTDKFVYGINSLREDKDYGFRFVRRGDMESNTFHSYLLINFARLVKAFLEQKPGAARTKGASTLLKQDSDEKNTDEKKFIDTGIFKDIFTSEETENVPINFNKYYKPTNFAFSLKSILTQKWLLEINEAEEEKDSVSNLIRYGRYFLIALIIFDINLDLRKDIETSEKNVKDSEKNAETSEKDVKDNEKNTENFSEWKYVGIKNIVEEDVENKYLSVEKLKKIVNGYFISFDEFVGNSDKYSVENSTLDANTFKTNEIYEEFKKYRIEKNLSNSASFSSDIEY